MIVEITIRVVITPSMIVDTRRIFITIFRTNCLFKNENGRKRAINDRKMVEIVSKNNVGLRIKKQCLSTYQEYSPYSTIE